MAKRRLLQACAKFGTIKFDPGWPWWVKGQRQNHWLKISRKRWLIRGWTIGSLIRRSYGFRLVLSDLTLDDFEWSKSRSYFLMSNMSKTPTVTMLDPTEITQSAHAHHFGWHWEVKGQRHNPLIRNIWKTVTDRTLNPRSTYM